MKEYDRVRLLTAIEGGTIDNPVTIPAGTEGVIVEVFGGGPNYGPGYEVDFTLRAPVFGPGGDVLDCGHYETESVNADKLVPLAPCTDI